MPAIIPEQLLIHATDVGKALSIQWWEMLTPGQIVGIVLLVCIGLNTLCGLINFIFFERG